MTLTQHFSVVSVLLLSGPHGPISPLFLLDLLPNSRDIASVVFECVSVNGHSPKNVVDQFLLARLSAGELIQALPTVTIIVLVPMTTTSDACLGSVAGNSLTDCGHGFSLLIHLVCLEDEVSLKLEDGLAHRVHEPVVERQRMRNPISRASLLHIIIMIPL